MTKKDYKLIAEVLRVQHTSLGFLKPGDEQDIWQAAIVCTARHLADELKQTNSKFDRERFLAACGL